MLSQMGIGFVLFVMLISRPSCGESFNFSVTMTPSERARDDVGSDLSRLAQASGFSWLCHSFFPINEGLTEALNQAISLGNRRSMEDANRLAQEELLATGVQLIVELRGEAPFLATCQDDLFVRTPSRDEAVMLSQAPLYNLFSFELFNKRIYEAGTTLMLQRANASVLEGGAPIRNSNSVRATSGNALYDIAGLGELLQACLELSSYKAFHPQIHHIFGVAELLLRPSFYIELMNYQERGLSTAAAEGKASERHILPLMPADLSMKLGNAEARAEATQELSRELISSLKSLFRNSEFTKKVLTGQECYDPRDKMLTFVPLFDREIEEIVSSRQWKNQRRLRWNLATKREELESVYRSGRDLRKEGFGAESESSFVFHMAESQRFEYFSHLPLVVDRVCATDTSRASSPLPSQEIFTFTLNQMLDQLNSALLQGNEASSHKLQMLEIASSLLRKHNGILTQHERDIHHFLKSRTSLSAWFYTMISFKPLLGPIQWVATDFLQSSLEETYKMSVGRKSTLPLVSQIRTPAAKDRSSSAKPTHKGSVFDALVKGNLGARSMIFFFVCPKVLSKEELFPLHELPKSLMQHHDNLAEKYYLRPYTHVASALWGMTVTDLPQGAMEVPRKIQGRAQLLQDLEQQSESEYGFVASFLLILNRLRGISDGVKRDKACLRDLLNGKPKSPLEENSNICHVDNLMEFMLDLGRSDIGWFRRTFCTAQTLLTNALQIGVRDTLANGICTISSVLRVMENRVVWKYSNYYDPNLKKPCYHRPYELVSFDTFSYSLHSINGFPSKKELSENAGKAALMNATS